MAINLSVLAPNTAKDKLIEFAKYINMYAPKYGVTTNVRIAAFLAQAVVESDGFRSMHEYTGRMGERYYDQYNVGTKKGHDLGNIYPGDGRKFHGRGIFQLTGRWNYGYFSKRIFGDDRLLVNPDLVAEPDLAVLTAFEFWKWKNMNKIADQKGITAVSNRVNGGQNGREKRIATYNKIMAMIKPAASTLTGVAVVLAGIFF